VTNNQTDAAIGAGAVVAPGIQRQKDADAARWPRPFSSMMR
jgi:hypothetical protein